MTLASPTKLVAAAAVARSGFPLKLLAATRGNADVCAEGFVLDACLPGVDGGNPLMVECRLPIGFTGECPDTSRLRTRVPFLVLVPGGSGSGRPEEGVDRVLTRLPGELVPVYVLGREGGLIPVMNSCRRAS